MSRIGKQPIAIPGGVSVSIQDGTVSVKGPKGELSRVFKKDITIEQKDNEVTLSHARKTLLTKALWGTYASHIRNMIEGVSNGFKKTLIIEGVGYRAEVSGSNLILHIGLSHTVPVEIPQGVVVQVAKNIMTISGTDKELVGYFSARIRALRPPEPYKGKGIRYDNEVVRRKQGKKAT